MRFSEWTLPHCQITSTQNAWTTDPNTVVVPIAAVCGSANAELCTTTRDTNEYYNRVSKDNKVSAAADFSKLRTLPKRMKISHLYPYSITITP